MHNPKLEILGCDKNSLQNTSWNVTIPTYLRENMSLTCRVGIESTLDHKKVEYEIWSSQEEKKNATL